MFVLRSIARLARQRSRKRQMCVRRRSESLFSLRAHDVILCSLRNQRRAKAFREHDITMCGRRVFHHLPFVSNESPSSPYENRFLLKLTSTRDVSGVRRRAGPRRSGAPWRDRVPPPARAQVGVTEGFKYRPKTRRGLICFDFVVTADRVFFKMLSKICAFLILRPPQRMPSRHPLSPVLSGPVYANERTRTRY